MPDISQLSDDQLLALHSKLTAAPKSDDLSHLSDDELIALHSKLTAPPPKAKPEFLDEVAHSVKEAGSAVMAGPVGQGMHWVGDKLERYADAPFRAGLGVAQDSNNPLDAFAAAKKQFGEDTLPTTPSGKQIMTRAGFSDQPISERYPNLFTKDGYGILPQKGGPLDVSDAGVMGGLAQPSMWAIPNKALSGLAGKAAEGVGSVAGKVAEVIEPTFDQVSRAASKTADMAKRGIFNAGETLTGGNLNARRAFDASEQLSGKEMLFPGSENWGPLKKSGKEVGAARDIVQEAKTVVPGSLKTLQEVRDVIAAGEERALRTPGSSAVLSKIDNLLEQGHDIHLGQADDLIRNMDSITYTPLGNDRSLEALWKGPISESRGKLNDLFQAAPEGEVFQGTKDQFSALSTAAKGRSKLMDGFAKLGGAVAAPVAVHALASGEPLTMLVAGTAALAAKAMSPRTYFQIVGSAKIPADMARGLIESYNTGKIAAVKDTMEAFATKYPGEMTKIATALDNAVKTNVADKKQPGRDAIKRRMSE